MYFKFKFLTYLYERETFLRHYKEILWNHRNFLRSKNIFYKQHAATCEEFVEFYEKQFAPKYFFYVNTLHVESWLIVWWIAMNSSCLVSEVIYRSFAEFNLLYVIQQRHKSIAFSSIAF